MLKFHLIILTLNFDGCVYSAPNYTSSSCFDIGISVWKELTKSSNQSSLSFLTYQNAIRYYYNLNWIGEIIRLIHRYKSNRKLHCETKHCNRLLNRFEILGSERISPQFCFNCIQLQPRFCHLKDIIDFASIVFLQEF